MTADMTTNASMQFHTSRKYDPWWRMMPESITCKGPVPSRRHKRKSGQQLNRFRFGFTFDLIWQLSQLQRQLVTHTHRDNHTTCRSNTSDIHSLRNILINSLVKTNTNEWINRIYLKNPLEQGWRWKAWCERVYLEDHFHGENARKGVIKVVENLIAETALLHRIFGSQGDTAQADDDHDEEIKVRQVHHPMGTTPDSKSVATPAKSIPHKFNTTKLFLFLF